MVRWKFFLLLKYFFQQIQNVYYLIVMLLEQGGMTDIYISFVLRSISLNHCVGHLTVMNFVSLTRVVGCIGFAGNITVKGCVGYMAVINFVRLMRLVGYILSVVMTICVGTEMETMETLVTTLLLLSIMVSCL